MMAAHLPPSSPAHPGGNGTRKLIQTSGTEHSQEGDRAPRCHARRQGDVGATVLGHWEGTAGSGQASPACCCSCLQGGCRNQRTGSQAGTESLSPHSGSSPSPHCASSERRGVRSPSSGSTLWIMYPPSQIGRLILASINKSINRWILGDSLGAPSQLPAPSSAATLLRQVSSV